MGRGPAPGVGVGVWVALLSGACVGLGVLVGPLHGAVVVAVVVVVGVGGGGRGRSSRSGLWGFGEQAHDLPGLLAVVLQQTVALQGLLALVVEAVVAADGGQVAVLGPHSGRQRMEGELGLLAALGALL